MWRTEWKRGEPSLGLLLFYHIRLISALLSVATSVLVLKAFEKRRPNILPALTYLLRRKASLPRSPLYLTLSIKRGYRLCRVLLSANPLCCVVHL